MLWALVASFAMVAGGPGPGAATQATPASVQPAQFTQQSSPKTVSAARVSSSEDTAAERELLQLANRDRREAGLPPLRTDESLTAAARAHAQLMVANAQLEHRFSGESSLLQRIAQVSALRLDRAGENIAHDSCTAGAEQSFMLSPPHRRNLLDPAFNVAGFAAIRSHGRLYVVQDFGHEVSTHTVAQTRELVSYAVNDVRRQAGLTALSQYASPKLDEAVCSLAQAGLPSARLLQTAYDNRRIITYTQSRPEILPQGAVRLLHDREVRQFAVGSCFARNAAYPTGMYWVAILLY
ncbi:MAG TPA: CAP domain-containing protein [Terriglobales bacterium]|nr:CAP domain-containing protein [Terriglobales bacterium]